MKCSFTRQIDAPPQKIWRILTDVAELPDRFPQFKGWSIKRDPRGADLVALSHQKRSKSGAPEYVVRLNVLDYGRVIEAEYLEADLAPMGHTVLYTLEPEEDGTLLSTVLDAEGLFGFAYMFFVIRQYLDRLKAVAEAE